MCVRFIVLLLTTSFVAATSVADAQEHAPGAGTEKKTVEAPTVFLDKSPRIVQYQLARLGNARLLMVPRRTDDKKYAPVYREILSRAEMSPQYRMEAVDALVTLDQSNPVAVLIEGLGQISSDDLAARRAQDELAGMLLEQPKDV